MINFQINYLLPKAMSLLFAFLFTYVAISKFFDHYYFESVLNNSPLISWASTFLSLAIPIGELALAILLISSFRETGLLLSCIILSTFTLYVAYMILFIPQLPCSCGGILNKLSWKNHLILNILLTFSGIIAWRFEKRNNRIIAITRISRTPV